MGQVPQNLLRARYARRAWRRSRDAGAAARNLERVPRPSAAAAALPGPACFKCRKRDDRRVQTGMTDGDLIVWHCCACGTAGQISNWQGSFWDLSCGLPSD